MAKADLTAQRLRQLFHYEPDTGVFTWLVATHGRGGNIPAGSIAGCLDAHGYHVITVGGRQYKSHRLAVLWMTGAWPPEEVDHIHGVKDDNRWAELRCASHRTNGENRHGPQSNNTTGFLGVYRNGKSGFGSRIKVDGVQIYLGTFHTREEAYAAHLEARRKLHGGNTL